jgi:signal transduction histidine kinase
VVLASLTNDHRHAGSGGCTVVLTYADECVDVEVHDDGPPPDATPIPGSGSGLSGLRAGVAMLDGEFDAGPDDVRGFRVRARLPLLGRAV